MNDIRPFLKWAGNKYTLLAQIIPELSPGRRLLEPFLGSGAVFLNTNYPNYVLSELNPDLTALYSLLKQEGLAFIRDCKKLFTPSNNNADRYYQLRDRFNRSKQARTRALLFVYLNRHGYNGLCRYNSSGKFNVPFGRYEQVLFPEQRMLEFHQKAQRAEFICQDFADTLAMAKRGDVVYCDPPYIPLSASAAFTAYAGNRFDESCQQVLADKALALQAKGVDVIISNHDTPLARKLYQEADIISFPARRFISCNAENRVPVQELLAIYRCHKR